MYYAQLENGLVKNIIIATPDIMADMEGSYAETEIDNLSVRFAEIGDGYDGVNFIKPPSSLSVWTGSEWNTNPEIGCVERLQMLKADGLSFITIYIAGNFGNEPQEVYVNDTMHTINTSNGRGEIELSSDTPELIVISWNGLTYTVVAYE